VRAGGQLRDTRAHAREEKTGTGGLEGERAKLFSLQIVGDDFVERRSFWAGDLDDAVSRRRDRHIGNDGSNVVRRDRLEQAGRERDDVFIRTFGRDAAEEFQKLGRADDRIGDAGGLDQFLLGDLGAKIAIVGLPR
jgi:hypothetical protein